jgi:hypothetical protein
MSRKLSLMLCLPLVASTMAGCPISAIGPDSPPEIVFIRPSAGSAAGGTSISIHGNNFVDGVSVTIGGQALVELSVVDRNTIQGKTPPGTIGTSDVVVTTSHGSKTLSAAYSYVSGFPIPFASADLASDVASAGIAMDGSGNVYVAGHTDKNFPGFINQGAEDLFVMKVDNNGALLWTQQLGTDGSDIPQGIASDSSGNVYVAGSTARSFPGFTLMGETDLYVIKFDRNGTRQWLQQLGTTRSDYARKVATDGSGNVYVMGTTAGSFPGFTQAGFGDVFVMKLSSDGVHQWTQQRGGVGSDAVGGIATDGAGHVYVVGEWGNNGGGYVMKFDGTGAELFAKPLGEDNAQVATDSSGAVYVAGSGEELQVSKLDGNGALLWTQPMGAAARSANGLALDSSGNIYLVGETNSHFPGFDNRGQVDTFVIKLDNAGTRQWVQQVGDLGKDWPTGAATDGNGNLFVGGYSDSVFPGQDNLYNNYDVFLMKFKPVGEMF